MRRRLSPDRRRRLWRLLLPMLLCIAAAPGSALAQDQGRTDTGQAATEPAAPTTLTVAVAECPPFVMIEEGRPTGLAIYLWQQVAAELALGAEFVEYPLGQLLESVGGSGLEPGIDAAVSCISVTVERETRIDFSHSFTETYTAIAVRQPSLGGAIAGFFSDPRVWQFLAAVLAIAFVIGALFYLLEHKINKKLYSSPSKAGKSVEAMIIGLLLARARTVARIRPVRVLKR